MLLIVAPKIHLVTVPLHENTIPGNKDCLLEDIAPGLAIERALSMIVEESIELKLSMQYPSIIWKGNYHIDAPITILTCKWVY